jgi:hypothetical protein
MKATAGARRRQVAMVVAPADVREGTLSDIEQQQARAYARDSYAASTKRAYATSREAFEAFWYRAPGLRPASVACGDRGLSPAAGRSA